MVLDFDKVFNYSNKSECKDALMFAYMFHEVIEDAPMSVRKQISLELLEGKIAKAEADYADYCGGEIDEEKAVED